MKTYIVYVKGVEVGYIKAGSHNAAEKKAVKKYGDQVERPELEIAVAYTEL